MKSHKMQIAVLLVVAAAVLLALFFAAPKTVSGENITSYLSQRQTHIITLQKLAEGQEYPALELDDAQTAQLLQAIETAAFQPVLEDNTSTNAIPFSGEEYVILMRDTEGSYVFAMQWSEELVLVTTKEGHIDGYLRSVNQDWVPVLQEIYSSAAASAAVLPTS